MNDVRTVPYPHTGNERLPAGWATVSAEAVLYAATPDRIAGHYCAWTHGKQLDVTFPGTVEPPVAAARLSAAWQAVFGEYPVTILCGTDPQTDLTVVRMRWEDPDAPGGIFAQEATRA